MEKEGKISACAILRTRIPPEQAFPPSFLPSRPSGNQEKSPRQEKVNLTCQKESKNF